VLHVQRPHAAEDRLSHLLAFATAEARERRAGSECMLLRISELLFVEVVRQHLAALPSGERGWLAGLNHPIVGRALALLHERPAEAWTVDELARRSGVSRSSLASSFSELVGQPPMQYLAHWRMQLAATLLSEGHAKVSVVALEVGYDSEAAFSRAFKALVGVPPATWRKRHSGAGGV
jgi:AraC-like DNA-binding protein